MKLYHTSTRVPDPKLIKQLIQDHGSLESVAGLLGVSYRSVQNWLYGKPISRLAYARIQDLLIAKHHKRLRNSVGVK